MGINASLKLTSTILILVSGIAVLFGGVAYILNDWQQATQLMLVAIWAAVSGATIALWSIVNLLHERTLNGK